MTMGPYQDRHLLSDFDFDQRTVVVGPLGRSCPPGHHPNTMIIYLLLDGADRARVLAAAQGQSLEKLPLFPHQRLGDLGTLDAFWQAPLARNTLMAAIQFIPTSQGIIVTHMAVKPKWQRQGINSRMVDCIKRRFPQHQITFHQPTEMGKKFIEGSC